MGLVDSQLLQNRHLTQSGRERGGYYALRAARIVRAPVLGAVVARVFLPLSLSSGLKLFRDFSQDDCELGFAGFGGVVEGVAGAVALGGFEEESVLEAVGEAGEASFAVDVGAEFEVEAVGVHESVGDADCNFGGVDGLAGVVVDGEVGSAGAEGSVDRWNRVRIGRLGQDRRDQDAGLMPGLSSGLIIEL